MIAAQKGFSYISEILLKNKADFNMQDQYQNTAIHYATISSSYEIVDQLLSQPSIDLNIHNFENKLAFELTKDKDILNLYH